MSWTNNWYNRDKYICSTLDFDWRADIRAVMIIRGNVKRIISGQKMVGIISVIIPRLTSPNPRILWKYSGWARTRSTFEGLQEATVSP